LSSSSPLELNLSSQDRTLVLRALNVATHPSAVQAAVDAVEESLRWQSHPNFARRQLANANKERRILLLGFSTFLAIATIVQAIMLILSNQARACRVFPCVTGATSMTAFVSQLRAFCFACYLKSRKDAEPWDLYDEDHVSVDEESREHSRSPSFVEFDEKEVV